MFILQLIIVLLLIANLLYVGKIKNILREEKGTLRYMGSELDALRAAVDAEVTVEQSAVTLLNGLSQQIKDLVANGGSPADFTALADKITASSTALAAAVTANTTPPPAAPSTTP